MAGELITKGRPEAGNDPRFPEASPRYRIDGMRGSGGVGTVYEAWDRELERKVALKFLRDDRPEHRSRMVREARAQARIDHPNVCHVFDVGEEGDRLFISMQWIDGETLDVAARNLSAEEKVRLLRDVADGVHAAHAEGVVHRDLKPANVLVAAGADGVLHPYVVDFGLARAMEEPGTTATGEIVGTAHYLSPEQAWGLPVDRRSDVYSLGATMYELLSGRTPFSGTTATDILVQVIYREPQKLEKVVPAISRDLSVIVSKCLDKQPERRYDSARALRDDLSRWLDGEPIVARPPGMARRAYAFVRRHRAVAIAVVAATILTTSVAAYQIGALRRERERREITARLEDRVRYIETLVDYDRRLPLHDTRQIRARAASEIPKLRSEDATRFDGPLDYAQGRALAAAGDGAAASAALQRAWSSGFRTPAVAYHFGLALTNEYARELAQADRITQQELRNRRIDELKKRYRDAVVPPLRIARGYVEQPPQMIDAHLAYVEGDDAATAKHTRAVLARFPWNNEARLLEANAMVRRAQTERQQGRYREARTKLERATEVYKAARLIAPSDIRIHDGLCQAAVSIQAIGTDSSGDMESDFAKVREACEQALIADPDRVSVLVALSAAWSRMAFYRGTHGGELLQELKAPVALAERALKLAPDDPEVLIQAGSAYFWTEVENAPRVVDLMRRAIARNPSSIEAQHGLGRALLRLNDLAYLNKHDPRPILAEGEAVYREIIRRAPEFVPAYNNLGLMLNHQASYAANHGGDPDPIYREIIELLEPQVAAHPEVATLCSTAANAWINLSHSLWLKGGDPQHELDQAERLFRQAIARNTNYWGDQGGLAMIASSRARYTKDPALRERAMLEADALITELERKGMISGREGWYLMRAEFAPDRATALRYLNAASKVLDTLTAERSQALSVILIQRAQGENIRCKFAPERCNRALRDAYLDQVEEIDSTRWRDAAWVRAQLPKE